jgi:hypothetical protein
LTSPNGPSSFAYLPFFEAYFSNFIEGTEFELNEAIALIYEGKKIPGRETIATT